MIFKRKAMKELKEWKEKHSSQYAILLEGARRVGKSTIAEEFAKKEYKSYIKIDFSKIKKEVEDVFDDIADLDLFFLRLQAVKETKLYEKESAIIFDEIQLKPKVRQAIKHLVADGRYSYIETGSLISIKKNVQDILIPSEEKKIQVYPMDYEEFLWATGSENYDNLRELYKENQEIGNSVNQELFRKFRIYMAVGGMPQAVEAYIEGKNFEEIDLVKRQIINLYEDDFRKIDNTGKLSQIYENIPSQLNVDKKRFVISNATGQRKSNNDEDILYDLLDSKTVLKCSHITDPNIALNQSKSFNIFKLYLADTGLFVTLLFNDAQKVHKNIYSKLLSDKLDSNLGFLYENVAAQMINSTGRSLYYHTWEKDNGPHYYEVDFLIGDKTKIVPVEVKSSSTRNHASIDSFRDKYSKVISKRYLLSQKDVGKKEDLMLKPIYFLPFILEDLE